MSEQHEQDEHEADVPSVADVPEPDQDVGEDEAEAEAEADAEHDHEPEQEASAPKDQRDIERALKKIDTARTTYTNRLSTILGEDFQAFVPCELCAHFVPGFRFPTLPAPEIVGRVRAAIGLPERENFKPSPYHERCDVCGGLGQLATGSLVTGTEFIVCPACNNNGFVRNAEPLPSTMSYAGLAAADVAANGETVEHGAGGISPDEATRRMQAAIAQAQGHAVGPPAEGAK